MVQAYRRKHFTAITAHTKALEYKLASLNKDELRKVFRHMDKWYVDHRDASQAERRKEVQKIVNKVAGVR